ncbi:MAG: glucodextranase DOMON-like domain-containing protein [Sulfolobales archaeon]|jgi:carbohydrate-binding DOMON domain-containing protein
MSQKILKSLLVASLILTIGIALANITASSQAQQAVISVSDPEGDDRGPGYYGYPVADVFKPGVFDLVKFEVYTNATHVIFKVYFKNLGGNPWNGPNGFCLQYTHIYIRTTETGLLGRMDTIGLNFALRSDYAWYYALLLAPGWDTDAVPVGQKAALYYSNGTIIVQDTKGFKVYAEPASNAIVAVVPKALLSDTDNIAKWKIVVAVASYDGFGPMRVRPVGPTGGEWVINGTAYATPAMIKRIATGISKGVEPRVMDLLIYSPEFPNGITADQQYKWLDSYDPDKGLIATVPYTPTYVTITATATTTTTLTQTSTYTLEKTVTSISTSVSVSTTTIEKTVTDWTTASILGVVLLIIGFVIGFFVKRK